VGQLFAETAKVKELVARLSLSGAAGPGMTGIDTGNEALARAFELKAP